MNVTVHKKLITPLLLAMVIIVAPEFHQLICCDDDAAGANRQVALQIEQWCSPCSNRLDADLLPNGLCCEAQFPLNALAYSNGSARALDWRDFSSFVGVIAFSAIVNLSGSGILGTTLHPPPSTARIFLTIHKFLI